MGIFNSLKNLDKRFSWSFFGFIIGIIGVSYAIYIDEFKEEKPKMVFEIITNTPVLSVRENLNGLDVIYKTKNLKENNENLILLEVKISNEGNKDIREIDYYSKTPFGFSIKNGKIVEKPILIEASNNILKKNLKIESDSLNTITLNKVPFNENQFIILKTLIISKTNELPIIVPSGVITGINENFPVINTFKNNQKDKLSFSEKITFGSPLVHITRAFFYIILILAGFGQIMYFVAHTIPYIQEEKRKKILKKYRNKTKIELSEKSNIIFSIYLEEGKERVRMLTKLFNQEEKLKKYISFYENLENENFFFDDFFKNKPKKIEPSRFEEYKSAFVKNNELVKNLLDSNIVELDKNNIIVNKDFKNEINEFNYFIEIQ